MKPNFAQNKNHDHKFLDVKNFGAQNAELKKWNPASVFKSLIPEYQKKNVRVVFKKIEMMSILFIQVFQSLRIMAVSANARENYDET